MHHNLSDADAEIHDAMMNCGAALCMKHIYLDENRRRLLGIIARWNLRKASTFFLRVLELNPGNHAAMWMLGKIYQRLGKHSDALSWFMKATALKPGNLDYAREAGITALEVGDATHGITLCTNALAIAPEESGLMANLALAYLAAGDTDKAMRYADQALARNCHDSISKRVKRDIQAVINKGRGSRRSREFNI